MKIDSPYVDPARSVVVQLDDLPHSSAMPGLDRLTRLAAGLLRAPVAFISVMREDQQVVVALTQSSDLATTQTGARLAQSLCRHVVETGEPVIVGHANQDSVFETVCGNEGLKGVAYVGIPIQCGSEGLVGSFCVIDLVARTWLPGEVGLLSELAACAATEIGVQFSRQVRGELEIQLAQLQRMETVGGLAVGLSHELNNILGSVAGNAALAQQDLDREHPANESIEEIFRALRRAKGLLQRILGLARPQPIARTLQSLRPIIEDSVRLARPTIPLHVDLAIQCADETPEVLADATQLVQVLLNLVLNAAHAIEGKSGRIDITLDAGSLEDGGADEVRPERRRCARLTVRDTGKGMDSATVAKIFQPFFTTKPPGDGTGLGLTVVRNIVEDHGGNVSVRSQPGKGTVFTLVFPVADSVAPDSRNLGRPILLVNGEGASSSVVDSLERRGFCVTAFHDSVSALRSIESKAKDYAIAVIRGGNPATREIEMARSIRALRTDLPVIVATRLVTEELRSQVRGTGIHLLSLEDALEDEFGAAVHSIMVGESEAT